MSPGMGRSPEARRRRCQEWAHSAGPRRPARCGPRASHSRVSWLAHGLGHEALDDSFAERSEHAAAETADETLYPDEGDAICLVRVSIEQVHPGGLQDFLDVVGLAGLVIMISQYADDWNGASTQILHENFCLTRLADVRQVAAKNEHFRLARYFGK